MFIQPNIRRARVGLRANIFPYLTVIGTLRSGFGHHVQSYWLCKSLLGCQKLSKFEINSIVSVDTATVHVYLVQRQQDPGFYEK